MRSDSAALEFLACNGVRTCEVGYCELEIYADDLLDTSCHISGEKGRKGYDWPFERCL